MTTKAEMAELAEKNETVIADLKTKYRGLLAAADTKTGEVSVDGKDIFESNLPETVTVQALEDLSNYVSNTAIAGHAASSEIGIEAMAANADLEKFTGVIGFGPIGKLTSAVSREVIGRNPSNGEETRTVGSNRATLDLFAPGGKRFNTAKSDIKAYAVQHLPADKLK